MSEDTEIKPFRIDVPQADLDHLRSWQRYEVPGGHYAAHLEAGTLVEDVRLFFAGLR
ncbi:hypothetical protein RB614_34165 [Phytohabitans sp. ZYX-F-186]|uniref:Uncharacterized protein n=1 Tax=Phytohabitans maris TaxID=3071409 RepID=A0ABU0ZRH9_9ACTN|nr:hypothetical protein [Phytohabitans sp. ZYX-F-186]MDQ7909578.1 hypothetical protein [Phytohabitans sp. ZYX-F-186]